MTVPNLLTADQVADLLKISEYEVLRMHREGKLPSIRLSHKAVRFDPRDINDYIDSRRSEQIQNVSQ